jgi:hypothetical protein
MTIFEKLYEKYKEDKGTLRARTPDDLHESAAFRYHRQLNDEDLDIIFDCNRDKLFLNGNNFENIPRVHDKVLLFDISEISSCMENAFEVDGDFCCLNGEIFGIGMLAIDMSNNIFPSFKNVAFPPNLIYLDLRGTVFGEVENITFPTDHKIYVHLDENNIFSLYKFLKPNIEEIFDDEKVFEEICNRISQQETIDNQ